MNEPDQVKPKVLLGIALSPTEYDDKARRSRCSQCRALLATGQAQCRCGAVFSATIRT